jgi:hypothetical protein
MGFNIINRIADALSFEIPQARGFLGSAQFLRIFGYRFLSGAGSRIAKRTRTTGWSDTELQGKLRRLEPPFILPWLNHLSLLALDPKGTLPEVARDFVSKVSGEPSRITDGDIQSLRGIGLSEDGIFELIVSAAAGAGLVRLRAGLDALCLASTK